MIKFVHKGNFKNTEAFFRKARSPDIISILDKYAREGVSALALATPVDSGKTASSWYYEISTNGFGYKISWSNSNINDNVIIAIILQYGHGTRNGGYVQGRDYINPAMRSVFDKLAEEAWKEVTL